MIRSAKYLKSTATISGNAVRSSGLAATGKLSLSVSPTKTWLHTTSCTQFPGQDWRKKLGEPANYNASGPLTDGPDYSFLDGRPTPVGVGKLRRAKEQKEIMTKIMTLTGEVDFAVKNHDARVQKEKDRRNEIINSKLKPKGRVPPEVKS